MQVRIGLTSASLLFAMALLTGCGSEPAAETAARPVHVIQGTPATAQAAPALQPQQVVEQSPVALAPEGYTPGVVPASDSGFSLPIGAAIPAPPPKAPSPATAPTIAQGPPSQDQSPPPPVAPHTRSSAGSAPATPNTKVHLSAGVAVPQSLPTGTVMAISVDYSLNVELNPKARYLWVIKSGAGERINEVKLDATGNLSAFFLDLKPEHRPFTARIEEVVSSRHRTIISNEVSLKSDY